MDAEQLKKLIEQGQNAEKETLHALGMIRGQIAAYQQMLVAVQADAAVKQNANGHEKTGTTEAT